MRNFKNIVASITYYRKHNIVLFLFFTISIFLLTTLEVLSLIQSEKLAQLTDSWSLLGNYLPHSSRNAFETITASDQGVQNHYKHVLKIAVTVISLSLIGLTGTLLYQRRQDIKSLISLGVGKREIVFQLIVEALFPIVLSFVVLLSLVLLFQNSFKQQTIALNDAVFRQELQAQVEKNGDNNTSPEGPTMIEQRKTRVLLPFKTTSFYLLETSDSFLNFSQMRQTLARTFLRLTALAFIVIALVTSLSVLSLSYRMNY